MGCLPLGFPDGCPRGITLGGGGGKTRTPPLPSPPLPFPFPFLLGPVPTLPFLFFFCSNFGKSFNLFGYLLTTLFKKTTNIVF